MHHYLKQRALGKSQMSIASTRKTIISIRGGEDPHSGLRSGGKQLQLYENPMQPRPCPLVHVFLRRTHVTCSRSQGHSTESRRRSRFHRGPLLHRNCACGEDNAMGARNSRPLFMLFPISTATLLRLAYLPPSLVDKDLLLFVGKLT